MTTFIPGLQLSELFYREAVQPILERSFPGLPYAATLLGPGSEVLGFDTAQSTDHNWGPRLLLFLSDDDVMAYNAPIVEILRQQLPHDFRGYPTNFGAPDEEGTLQLKRTAPGPVNHKVDVTTVARFLSRHLGIDAYPEVDIADWLVCSEQRLLELTAGKVFHDGLGEVERVRATFHYYPREIWLYLLAAQWKRIAQQEPFVGRCGDVGDDLGSALVAATLLRDLMRLCFLMERTYAPYSKWFGTAFARLACAGQILPLLAGVAGSTSWRERERHLSAAYTVVASLHNSLEITDPLPTDVSRFHDRPYLVIDAERFTRAIRARIADERVRRLSPDIGSIDQFVDSTDVLTNRVLRAKLKAVYSAGS